VWDTALAHLRTAGRLAAARSAYEEAETCYADALDVCQQASSWREVAVASTDIQVELGSALHGRGDITSAVGHYRNAEAAALALGDAGRVAWIVAAMSYAHTSLGQHRTAIELAHRALATSSGGEDDSGLRIWVQQSLVRTSYAAGDYQAAVSMARAILETAAAYVAEEPSDPIVLTPVAPSVGIRGFLALALSALGRFDDAVAEGAEAVRSAEKMNRSPELAWANYCLGRTVLEQGNAEQAGEYLERAFALMREWEPTTRVSVAPAALETARAPGQSGPEALALRFLSDIARRRRPGTVEPPM
jgi:tetratricopeptide (TPR) repeat protein